MAIIIITIIIITIEDLLCDASGTGVSGVSAKWRKTQRTLHRVSLAHACAFEYVRLNDEIFFPLLASSVAHIFGRGAHYWRGGTVAGQLEHTSALIR